ncbi:hypothetical protein [Microvirga sp. VF16]|uniref:hypothetical protein n=1 Tax=Microvirga sp. VF16 TaxID=2807101 RepID=UPI001FEE2C44|nr:hypothetical protein [Microvirga sp. VF16]
MSDPLEVTMGVAGFPAVAGFGSIFASIALSGALAAEGGLSAFQGAWLAQGPSCADVYSSDGKAASFRRPVDIFAPAFIVSGNRLRTPMASCRIRSTKPTEDRHTLLLDCANAVAGNEVRVLMAMMPDGSLKRYLNEQDTTGTSYQRCSR